MLMCGRRTPKSIHELSPIAGVSEQNHEKELSADEIDALEEAFALVAPSSVPCTGKDESGSGLSALRRLGVCLAAV
jgi:hypothetical protein